MQRTLVTGEDAATIYRELKVPRLKVSVHKPGVNHGGVLFQGQAARSGGMTTYRQHD